VVFPEPEPPAIPMTSGVVRLGINELYWKQVKRGNKKSSFRAVLLLFEEPTRGIEPLTYHLRSDCSAD
jgi:hypothetical protein